MKRFYPILWTLLLCMGVPTAYGQSGKVSATVIDAETRKGVAGAVIEFAPADTTLQKRYFTSGYGGRFEVSVPCGEYGVAVSFLGYETAVRAASVASGTLSLGTVELKPAATQIETVVKEVQAMRTSQKGDTLIYNAEAFKVTADASVERLLRKMPGITVSDGEVEAQGENVKRIYVDGKEFFSEDVNTAIKTLPAVIVDKVEVFDKLSDAAEFSGVDDGEGYKAINIVTKPNMRQGVFGKVYGGYGYQPETEGLTGHHKYNVGGNINLFHGSSRLSLIGLSNNVNKQNFALEDIISVSGGNAADLMNTMMPLQTGVAQIHAFGFNYTDYWGKTGNHDKVQLQASYFYDHTTLKNRSAIDRWYEAPSPPDTLHQEDRSNTFNGGHRFNARLEWRIAENQSLMSRTGLTYQNNDSYEISGGHQWGESGYRVIDDFRDGNGSGLNLHQYLSYRLKLGKDGRTLTLDGDFTYRDSRNDTYSHSNLADGIDLHLIAEPSDTLLLRYQSVRIPSYSYNVAGNVTYTEPLSEHALLNLQYRVAYNYQESDKRAYVTGPQFDTAGLEPDPALSQFSNSGYLTHRVGPGFQFAKNANRIQANIFYQHAELAGNVLSAAGSLREGAENRSRYGFDNLIYSVIGFYRFNPQNSVRLNLSSATMNPNIGQLQDICDVTNAQNIVRGNPRLRPSYAKTLFMNYINTNMEKGRTFLWFVTMEHISDYITSHIAYDLSVPVPTGETDAAGDPVMQIYNPYLYSAYVNMDGFLSVSTQMNYAFPVSFLKSNFTLMAGLRYCSTPSMVGGTLIDGNLSGGQRNEANEMNYTFQAWLDSNISENADFSLSWSGVYSHVRNSLDAAGAKNRYFLQQVSAGMKFILPRSLTITASAEYNQYIGFTNDYDYSYVLCNVYLGKKLFRTQRGELMLGVNDLFNRNTSFSRTIGSGYAQNTINGVIGRYVTVQFVYNLTHFGKHGSKNIKDYDVMRRFYGNIPPSSDRPKAKRKKR